MKEKKAIHTHTKMKSNQSFEKLYPEIGSSSGRWVNKSEET